MSEPGHPAPAPGWYPDPDGTPGRVRWWNGADWSDVTAPAGPGVRVHAAPVQAQVQAPARPVENPGAPPAPSPRRPSAGWVLGLSALGVVLVVLIGFLVGRPSSGLGDERAQPAPSAPAGPTFPPGTVRIIDEAAGIAYPYLGGGWYEYDKGLMLETTSVAGQFFTTQDLTPDGGTFIAQCTSGPLSPAFGYGGPAGLQATLGRVTDSVRANYYPAPNERRDLRDEALTIDGVAAHLVEFDLAWDVEGYDATGERAAVILIDVGRAAPAMLYISIPNTHAELYGVIDQVVSAVDVL